MTYLTKKDLLPDSRPRETKGRIFTTGGTWVPLYCANCCSGPHGWCPEENMNFVFYLCNKCAETHGPIAGMMLMPDEVFFEELKQAQLEHYGRFLTEVEIAAVVEADASPLATLLKQRL